MGEIKTYTCDICNEVIQPKDLYTMSLNLVGPVIPGVGSFRRSINNNKHACRDCCKRLDVKMPPDNRLTTEDSLLDMLRAFIQKK